MTQALMFHGIDFGQAPPWLRDRTILVTEAGSRAYGLATPESDLDIRGIGLEPVDHVIGFSKVFEQFQIHGNYCVEGAAAAGDMAGPLSVDVCVFGLRKFCHLATLANPNVLELLAVRPESIRFKTPAYDQLRANIGLFLSQKARHTFRGYAMSQLKKIQHKADVGTTGKRAEVIARFGYDTKHAMHLVRLMRMGHELLSTGVLNVWRDDRDELLAVRRGEWPLADLLAWAKDQDEKLGTVASPLPWGPDITRADALCRELLLESWAGEIADKIQSQVMAQMRERAALLTASVKASAP